ncbi:Uncharacterised protein [Acinetobacter baumannii]|nr:Uncharacterised protein [Acinetobacter baumannii]
MASNSAARRALAPARVQQDGFRAVVVQVHLHVGLKDPGFHVQALCGQEVAELLVEPLALVGGGGLAEAGAVAPAGVSVESELRHHQHFAPHLGQAQVQLAFAVAEDPQSRDFAG